MTKEELSKAVVKDIYISIELRGNNCHLKDDQLIKEYQMLQNEIKKQLRAVDDAGPARLIIKKQKVCIYCEYPIESGWDQDGPMCCEKAIKRYET